MNRGDKEKIIVFTVKQEEIMHLLLTQDCVQMCTGLIFIVMVFRE